MNKVAHQKNFNSISEQATQGAIGAQRANCDMDIYTCIIRTEGQSELSTSFWVDKNVQLF